MRRESFKRFCARHAFVLTPGQSVVTSVCFDDVEPSVLSGEDREIAREQFGDVDTIPATARSVVVWKKGARIGGSRMAALRLYQLGLTVPLAVAPGEPAYGLIVGPDMRLARHAYAYALGAAKADAAAGAIAMVNESADSFTFQRYDGRLICMECLPATRGGSAVRGRTLVGAVMTEGAFFRDAESIVNDEVVFRGIVPRVVPGGQVIIESTPWTELGLLYTLFKDNFGAPATCIAAHLPTLLMRPDEHTRSIVARERERDLANALQEFDAVFRSSDATAALLSTWVDAAIHDAGYVERLGPPIGICDSSAGKGDAWTFAIGQVVQDRPMIEYEGEPMGDAPGMQRVYLDSLGNFIKKKEQAPPHTFTLVFGWGCFSGKFREKLKFDAIVDRIAMHFKAHGVTRAFGDQYQGFALESGFARHGITYSVLDWGNTNKTEMLARARNWFRDRDIVIEGGEESELIRKELVQLQEKPLAGGGTMIGARRGGFDDRAAIILNLALADSRGELQGSPIQKDRRVYGGY